MLQAIIVLVLCGMSLGVAVFLEKRRRAWQVTRDADTARNLAELADVAHRLVDAQREVEQIAKGVDLLASRFQTSIDMHSLWNLVNGQDERYYLQPSLGKIAESNERISLGRRRVANLFGFQEKDEVTVYLLQERKEDYGKLLGACALDKIIEMIDPGTERYWPKEIESHVLSLTG